VQTGKNVTKRTESRPLPLATKGGYLVHNRARNEPIQDNQKMIYPTLGT